MHIIQFGLGKGTVDCLLMNHILVSTPDLREVKEVSAACDWIDTKQFDLVVINLTKMSLGMYVAKDFRKRGVKIPIIGVLDKNSEGINFSEARAIFLENGGDDLFVEPVRPREFIAVMRAVSRRNSTKALDFRRHVLKNVELVINRTTCRVYVNMVEVKLTASEYRILEALSNVAPTILNRAQLSDKINNEGDAFFDERNIDSHVKRLRKRIAAANPGTPSFIETIYGMGYRMVKNK